MKFMLHLLLVAGIALPLEQTFADHHKDHAAKKADCCDQPDCCKDCKDKEGKHTCCEDKQKAKECCKNCKDKKCEKACADGKCRKGHCDKKRGKSAEEGDAT